MSIIENGIKYSLHENQKEILVGNKLSLTNNNAVDSSLSHAYVIIPERVHNLKVTRVLMSSFRTNDIITHLSFPCTITTLEKDSCAHMPKLEQVIFRGKSQLKELHRGVFYNDKSLSNIILPPLINSIDIYCFGTTQLQNLV